MCDLHFKFEEDRTKTVVAIDGDRQEYFGQTDRQTDGQTNTRVILYLSSVMNCTGKTKT